MKHRNRPASICGALAALVLLLAFAGAAGAQIPCGASTACLLNPVCQPDGTCGGTILPNTTTCDDLNPCTVNDHCNNGVCQGTNAPASTTCNDSNPCTNNDHCSEGVCQGSTDPAKLNQPCDIGVTHPCILGATCSQPAGMPAAICLPNIKQCPDNDGNKCTIETCDFLSPTGACTTQQNVCGDQCNTASCRTTDGVCINSTPKPNGSTCNDLNICTSPDSCQAGVCVGAAAGGPTSTPTRTATAGGATATRTVTPVSGTATSTRTAASPSPTSAVSGCLGDCDSNNMVSSADVAKIRSTMSLCPCPGGVPGGLASGCAAVPNGCVKADYNGDGCLRAAELTHVLDNVLSQPNGCGAMPGEGSVAARAAGVLQSTTTAFLSMTRVVGSILGPIRNALGGGGGGATTLLDLPFTCPTSGGGTMKCDQEFGGGFPPTVSPPIYTLTLNACKATTSMGRTVTFNGAVTATGQAGEFCGTLPSPLQVATQNLTVEEVGPNGSFSAAFSSFSATVNLSGFDADCIYDDIQMSLSGDMNVVAKNGVGTTVSTTQAHFGMDSMFEVFAFQFGESCVPVQYLAEVSGDITLMTDGSTFAGSYDQYQMTVDATSGNNEVAVDGMVTSPCLGSPVNFLTSDAMVVPAGALCPNAGEVQVEFQPPGDSFFDSIHYGPGSVGIDEGDDGTINKTFNSCVDPTLYVCPSP